MRTLLVICSLTLVACGETAAVTASGGPAGSTAAAGGAPGKSGSGSGSNGGHSGGAGGPGSATTNCWPVKGGASALVKMSGVTSEADNRFDRLQITFDSGVPSYVLSPNTAGTQFSAAGLNVGLSGSFGLLLQMSNVTTPARLLLNGDLQLQSTEVQEVRLLSATGTVATFGIGLSKDACPRVSTTSSPPGLVFDFPT